MITLGNVQNSFTANVMWNETPQLYEYHLLQQKRTDGILDDVFKTMQDIDGEKHYSLADVSFTSGHRFKGELQHFSIYNLAATLFYATKIDCASRILH